MNAVTAHRQYRETTCGARDPLDNRSPPPERFGGLGERLRTADADVPQLAVTECLQDPPLPPPRRDGPHPGEPPTARPVAPSAAKLRAGHRGEIELSTTHHRNTPVQVSP